MVGEGGGPGVGTVVMEAVVVVGKRSGSAGELQWQVNEGRDLPLVQ